MKRRGDATTGYTLLEVMLFLAISSALALIAFTGLGPRLSNARFTDATRALQSDITREISNAQIGVNGRSDATGCSVVSGVPAFSGAASGGSSQDCIINGRLVELSQSKATYFSIVSLRKPNSAVASCNQDTIAIIASCYKPTIVISSEPIPLVRSYKNGLEANKVVRFGYLQNPNNTNKHYFFYGPSPEATPLIAAAATDTTSEVCLTLGSRKASLTLSVATPQPVLNAKGCKA